MTPDRAMPHAAPAPSPLPELFGRYLLIQRLSRGGMGEIFLAKHGLPGFEKLCVIKKVLPHLVEDQQFISRFVDEASVAIKLQHAHIAQVFEVGRVGNEYFLAIEYIDGRDLRRILGLLASRRQRVPVDLALLIGRDLAAGLSYAHRRSGADGQPLNLVHCDVSPPNILVSFEGETKIIDFGIARSAIRATASDPKIGFGKYGYMAPEQLIRGASVDHRADIYAAGVVLFELLTGRRLYDAGDNPDYRELARMVTKGQHLRPSDCDPLLAPYDSIVERALRPRPADRFQSAADLRDAIQSALVAQSPTISTEQLGGFLRGLFAAEMGEQRALADRAAVLHVADFEKTSVALETVSFAAADLPLRSSASSAPPVRGTASRKDVTAPATTSSPRGRSWAWLAVGAVLLAATVIAILSSRSWREAPALAPMVAELPIDAAAVAAALNSAVSADAAVAEVEMPAAIIPDAGTPAVRPARPKEDHTVTEAAVREKFQRVRREYETYRERYGGRLETDWTALMHFAQFDAQKPETFAELGQRLDRFRAKMNASR